ncbi:phage tail protein [Kingella kingae]|uniref:phage baseplate assembly protein n=1 Tax=Kingella kingae TaxID=504 RepID=UPI00040F6F3E|nr:tail protein [Kingella kingae]MDK4527021.1 phage tail protein [Kingella kingae]MDK4533109.1 phage tail protein [Kingella kingae]MDK4576515.1 phage tail protein [Kingella kingae]MDK4582628.1 phage tail protein [Kingella kingae]MDK4594758.1 phage tail protein [Kingella kingae]
MTALSYQNTIAVRIGGQEHRDWQSYDIDSDFLIPADGFDFELGVSSLQNEIPNMAGERCEVVINGETVLTGIIGSQRHDKSKGSRNLRLTGRDLACLLVDCSAPQLNVKGMTVLAAIKKLVEPWSKYIAKVALKAESNPTLDKIDIEPSETVWQAATHIANSVGLHIWLEADGTLIVGGADYSSPPVATLCWSRNDARRNIESLTIERSSDNRYSEVTFLAQSHGRSGNSGKHDLKWVYKDPNMTLHKPKTVVVADADNLENLKRQAKKQLSDWQLEGLTITISVGDHKTQSGKLWQAGQRVHLIDEEEGIDAIFFIMGRRFTLSRMGGTHTELRLKEDGVWTPDAYPKKAAHARKRTGKKKTAHGKNQNQELESK